jgi:hypothetical protein
MDECDHEMRYKHNLLALFHMELQLSIHSHIGLLISIDYVNKNLPSYGRCVLKISNRSGLPEAMVH